MKYRYTLLPLDSPHKGAVTPFSTSIDACPKARPRQARALLVGVSITVLLSLNAYAVPLPKPRPIPRNVTQQTTPAKPSQQSVAPTAVTAPVQTAARPVPPPKKPSTPLAMSSTSSTPKADAEAVEQVIEFIRNKKQSDATQAQTAIGDPVARKLAEWLILRSDDNGARSERYRAFLSENPSWPSQSC